MYRCNGSYGNDFSPPRACALRYGWSARSRSRACSSAIATLTVARASSFRVRLSRSHLRISKAASVRRVLGLELRRQRLHIGAAGGSTRTLARLFPRASPLGERCSVVDTVPKATRTPPRVPICVRAEKSPLSSVSPRGNGGWRVAPDGEELRAVRCVWSHRPCIELLYRSYMDGFQ